MIILSSEKYKQLKDIHESENDNLPDIIVYKRLFNKYVNYLDELLYLLNQDTLYSFNPEIKDSIPFPDKFNYLVDKVNIISGYSYNSCWVKKYKYSENYKLFEQKINQENIITPFIIVGEPRVLLYKKKGEDNKVVSIVLNNGDLILNRYLTNKWDIILKPEEEEVVDESFFYIISFYELSNLDINNYCDPIKIKKKITLPYSLKKIYSNTRLRTIFKERIKYQLQGIHKNINQELQCINNNNNKNLLSNHIKILNLIGKGDWGNVFSGCLVKDFQKNKINKIRKFALKMARITNKDFENPYSNSSLAWYEIWMLKDIFKPLITKDICPNLPLYIDTFLCKKCNFQFKNKYETHPCIINILELGSGDFRDFLLSKSTHEDDIIISALFQIMAGLHAIQMSGQILNNDIKARNILYYNTIPGGYWVYRINGTKFYVPNKGKIFILTDFGVSTLFNPNFQLYRKSSSKIYNLGSRYAINIKGKFHPFNSLYNYDKNGDKIKNKTITWIKNKKYFNEQNPPEILPQEEESTKEDFSSTTKGVSFRLKRSSGKILNSKTILSFKQKNFLFKNKININPLNWGFFEFPNIIPPFEFYNDVQDLLRTFTGGKRTTQRGNHKRYLSISEDIVQEILHFSGQAENSRKNIFSLNSYEVLAGDFIYQFFKVNKFNYLKKPQGKKLAFYNMNNRCMKNIILQKY